MEVRAKVLSSLPSITVDEPLVVILTEVVGMAFVKLVASIGELCQLHSHPDSLPACSYRCSFWIAGSPSASSFSLPQPASGWVARGSFGDLHSVREAATVCCRGGFAGSESLAHGDAGGYRPLDCENPNARTAAVAREHVIASPFL